MADNTRAHTIGATMYSVSFTNIYTAEKMIYLPMQFVFSEDELKDGFEALIKKYKLNPYYRDIKLAKKEDLPKKFPLDVLKFNAEGFCELISLRAMHRICVSELFTKDIHFLFNKYLKEKMFTYDNEHGCIIKTRLNRKMVPVKFNVAIYSGEKDVIQRNAMHIDSYFIIWQMTLLTVFIWMVKKLRISPLFPMIIVNNNCYNYIIWAQLKYRIKFGYF